MSEAGAGACEKVEPTVILKVDPGTSWSFMRRGVKHSVKFRLPPIFPGWALTPQMVRLETALGNKRNGSLGFVCCYVGKVVG